MREELKKMIFCFILQFGIMLIAGLICYYGVKDYSDAPIVDAFFAGTMFGFVAIFFVMFYVMIGASILEANHAEIEPQNIQYIQLQVLPGTDNDYIYISKENNQLYYNVITTNGNIISIPTSQVKLQQNTDSLCITTYYQYKNPVARFFVPPALLGEDYVIQVPNININNTYYLYQYGG